MAKDISSTIVLKVSDREVENSFNGLRGTVSKLGRELRKLTPGTKEFMDKAAELREAQAHFERVRNEISAVNDRLSHGSGVMGFFRKNILEVGQTFRQVFTANIASNFFDSIIYKGKESVSELLKIADAMTDVQKTTNMALEEVKQLWDEFDKMNTRTSKLDRLKIAEVGGRLGVPKEQMASFVQEIDKAYVALGDSFDGGLEGVVDSLGKIKGLFEDTKAKSYADAINEVGSALNELAANGTASEGNISNFALRVGVLPEALKPAIDKTLGLGAAFEESGVDAQIAASGYSNFTKVAGENLDKFAYSMHMSLEEATKLFNEDPAEFFLTFAEGMRGLPADETVKIFESLKINSLEVQKAIGAAANRTDEFREAMKRSAVAMDEATSLTDEFNKKNNNAPGIIEKLKNAWSDFFTKTNILNALEGLIQAIGWLTGVTSEAGDGVLVFKERMKMAWDIIKVITAGLLGYKTVVIAAAIAEGNFTKAKWLGIVADKAQAAGIFLKRTAILLYEVALGVATLSLNRITAATTAFNIVTKASPLGLITGLIAAAIVAYKALSKEIDEVTQKQRLLNSVKADAANKTVNEKEKIESLLRIIKDENQARSTQERALKKLNDILPERLRGLTLEKIKTKETTAAINEYIRSLDRKAMADALYEKNVELKKQRNDLNAKSGDDYLDWTNLGGIGVKLENKLNKGNLKTSMSADEANAIDVLVDKAKINKILSKYVPLLRSAYWKRRKEMSKNFKAQKNLKSIQLDFEKNNAQDVINSIGDGGGNRIVPDDPKKPKTNSPARNTANDELKNAKSEYQKALELNDKNKKELLELEHKFQDEKFKILEESKQKEWDLELQDFKRKKEAIEQENQERITANKKLQNEIDALSVKVDETKSPEAKAILKSAIAEKKKQQDHNIKLIQKNNELEAAMLKTHGYNLMRIEEKWEIKRYQKEAEALQRSADLKRKEAEDEIIKITNFEEAKAKLKNLEHLKLTEQELQGIRTLEDAKKALREDADRAYLKAQEDSLNKQKEKLLQLLKDPSLQGEALEQLNKDLAKLEEQITRIKSAIQGKNEEDDAKASSDRKQRLSNIDLLGFSADQWEDMFKNLKTTEGKIKAVQMATQALSNAFSRFAQLQQNLNDREMQKFSKNQDKKKKALLIQLNHGLISQEEYHKGVQLLEEQTTNKKEELAKKYAKIQKILAVSQITISTAQAIMGIWKDFPKVDFGATAMVMSGVVAALGAAQIATVLAQPDSFAQGGYTGPGYGSPDKTGKRPAGIVHGNEYVTPDWMLENPVIADTVEWMEAIRTGRLALPKGYADGGFVDDAIPRDNKPVEASSLQAIPTLDPKMQLVLMQLKELLEDLSDNGVDAYIVESAENGRKIKRMIKKIEKIENKNARRKL